MKTFNEYLAEKSGSIDESKTNGDVVFSKKGESGYEWRIIEKVEHSLELKKPGPKTKWTHYLDLTSIDSGKEMIERSEKAYQTKHGKNESIDESMDSAKMYDVISQIEARLANPEIVKYCKLTDTNFDTKTLDLFNKAKKAFDKFMDEMNSAT